MARKVIPSSLLVTVDRLARARAWGRVTRAGVAFDYSWATQDTASLHRFREGVPPEPPPLPGGVTTVLRTIFNAPLWMWVVGLLIAVTAGVLLLRLLWRRRQDIRVWLTTRSRLGKIAVAHVPAIEELLQRGLVQAPRFIPHFLDNDAMEERVAALRGAKGLAAITTGA